MSSSLIPNRKKILPAQFLFGVAYYPEHDRAEHLATDVERLLAANVNVVRMAEFAWDLMEPTEGQFDFSLFDEHIARLGERGIKTILCTPTAAPPAWLTRKYPEVLQVNSGGIPMAHGSRQHASLCSPRFREFSRRITAAMASHFAGNAHVIGWQTDNEIYCHFHEDYSEAAHVAFRAFLKTKYRTIDALNDAWGTRFWAQTYHDFEEVQPPLQNRPAQENPGQRLDFSLFISDKAVRFQRDQVQILRAANASWWITHNGVFRNIDYREFSADLDFMAVDVYPMLAFLDAPGETSSAIFPARLLARTRSICGKFIVTELQSGPGGQGDWMSATPEPGQMRLFAWQCIAHGADGVLHFRWRTCRFGAEEYWEGVLDHDNQPRRRFEELCGEGREFAAIAERVRGTEVKPDVGIIFEMGVMEFGHRPITHGLPSPWEVADAIFTAWSEQGYNVGYVHPLDNLSAYKLLFLCSNAIVPEKVARALSVWVKQGGVLVILARSGTKDEFGRVIATTPPGLLTELAGCSVEEHSKINQPVLTGSLSASFQWVDVICRENLWREILRPQGGTVVATWQEGRLAGAPAVVENKYGKGKCIYIGTYASTSLASAWLPTLASKAGVVPLVANLLAGVEVLERSGEHGKFLFILNHTGEAKILGRVPAGTDLISGQLVRSGQIELAGFGVAVIETLGVENNL